MQNHSHLPLLSPETMAFAHAHREDDVRHLALSAKPQPGVDFPAALQQVAGYQRAKTKLPAWAVAEGIVFPPQLSMEQCSSEFTAQYKARVAQAFWKKTFDEEPQTMVDLTGGFGVDFHYISRCFPQAVYVEQNEALCQVAQHNFTCLGHSSTEVVNTTAEEWLSQGRRVQLAFLDPARRDIAGGKTVRMEDCTPSVIELLPKLFQCAQTVMLKLSPMLDHHLAIKQLTEAGARVHEVHVTGIRNECKELVFILTKAEEAHARCAMNDDLILVATDGKDAFSTTLGQVRSTPPITFSEPLTDNLWLHEPHAALMKLGCFSVISRQWQVAALSVHSHLFVSHEEIPRFPGRSFQIKTVCGFNKKSLKTALGSLRQANIATRNFPMSVAALRQKLRLKEGGNTYIFATTSADGSHILLICERRMPGSTASKG